MKKLPIGIQTFAKIRDPEDEHYYVDKTKILAELVNSGSYFFLSRPRRFGKSLFLDTLKDAFEGNQSLFKGLYLENNWDWTKKYPVIKIDFGMGVLKTPENLQISISDNLNLISRKEEIPLRSEGIPGKFKELIQSLESKYSAKVVILIDEYDKPILDNITESETARKMRDELRNFYSVIKGSDAHLKFVFITGVSKFSKVNLFSGLNNLQDITLDERFATICGYTEKDLAIFEDRMEGVNREELKLWYNGYNFLGEKVYNPFDILLFLNRKDFKNYWCETGNPTFLIDLIQKNQYNPISIEKIEVSEEDMGSFDVDHIQLEVLLFQTGYLTILKKERIGVRTIYKLTYPNLEVRSSLNSVILMHLSNDSQNAKIESKLYKILQSGDPSLMKPIFHSFFASIPHDWYRKNKLANYEAYYASIFYCYFASLGLDVRAEDVTNHGQVDMTVFFENKVFVLEFKVIELTEKGSALSQIKQKRYYEKHLNVDRNGDFVGTGHSVETRHALSLQNPSSGQIQVRDIYLIGVEFSREDRNITNLEWEKV